MPRIPRSLPPSGLTDPSLVPQATKGSRPKSAVPHRGEPAKLQQPKNAMLDILSMQNWDVDPARVHQHLTERELKVDEHNGMVSDPGRGSAKG